MGDAWRYAIWPDPRSRSRALQSRKSGHFQKLSPLPFTMGAGNWPMILKATISKFDGAGFFIFVLVFVSRDLTWHGPSVHVYVHLSTKIFDFNEICHVGRRRWVMHDGMQFDPIQGQGHEPFKVENSSIFNRYLCHLQWELSQLTTDHGLLN